MLQKSDTSERYNYYILLNNLNFKADISTFRNSKLSDSQKSKILYIRCYYSYERSRTNNNENVRTFIFFKWIIGWSVIAVFNSFINSFRLQSLKLNTLLTIVHNCTGSSFSPQLIRYNTSNISGLYQFLSDICIYYIVVYTK